MQAATGGPHERGGKHMSGAEDLVPEQEIEERLLRFWRKASTHSRGELDFCRITVEKITAEIVEIPVLSIRLFSTNNTEAARSRATALLKEQGIATAQIELAFNLLTKPPADLRGAWILAADTGRIIRENVRVTRFGWKDSTLKSLQNILAANSLSGTRIQEALALASKVNACPQIIAEICWSDNPDYSTGYVASSVLGYCRLPNFKPAGKGGGRIFWIEREQHVNHVINWLREVPCLIGGKPGIRREDMDGELVL